MNRFACFILAALTAGGVWITFTTPQTQWSWWEWGVLGIVTVDFFIDSYKVWRDWLS